MGVKNIVGNASHVVEASVGGEKSELSLWINVR